MDIATLLGLADTWAVVKIMFLIGMFLYVIFAFVIVKQINHMTTTLRVGFETPIRVLGLLHFVSAIIVLILAAIYL